MNRRLTRLQPGGLLVLLDRLAKQLPFFVDVPELQVRIRKVWIEGDGTHQRRFDFVQSGFPSLVFPQTESVVIMGERVPWLKLHKPSQAIHCLQ